MNSLNSEASILPRRMSAALKRKFSSWESVIFSCVILGLLVLPFEAGTAGRAAGAASRLRGMTAGLLALLFRCDLVPAIETSDLALALPDMTLVLPFSTLVLPFRTLVLA